MRGLSLDVGRKFFPLDYVDDLVKVLSYYKLNSLRLHLNDNGFPYYFANDWDKTYAAFRMESDTFPGLTSRDGYYTKQQMRDLQRTSAGDMVEIVPEIDIPAHALAFARYRGIGSKEFGEDHLDLFNPATMPFLDSLFHEYLGGIRIRYSQAATCISAPTSSARIIPDLTNRRRRPSDSVRS